jgi:hypothetical protein
MNTVLKIGFATAAIVAVAVVSLNVLPWDGTLGSPGAAPPSPLPSATRYAVRLSVAGSVDSGSALLVSAELPIGWSLFEHGAFRGPAPAQAPAGMAFFVSLVDNTFKDPCGHVPRNPRIGATVPDLATALGEIPGTTATKPVATSIAEYPATYVELGIPASLPCPPNQFYLWQDSRDGFWWPRTSTRSSEPGSSMSPASAWPSPPGSGRAPAMRRTPSSRACSTGSCFEVTGRRRA